MTNDTKFAFEHPEARAKATAGRGFNDRISLRDHITEVEIGAFQVERGTTQRLQFDVVVEVGAATAPLDDDVDRILSYDTLVTLFKKCFCVHHLRNDSRYPTKCYLPKCYANRFSSLFAITILCTSSGPSAMRNARPLRHILATGVSSDTPSAPRH